MKWFAALICAFVVSCAPQTRPASAALFSGTGGGVVPPTTIQVYSGCTAVPTTWAATTWYVNAGGNDANAGTIGSPFKHIAKAFSVASGGDTIDLQDSGGSFPGYPTDFAGAGFNPGIQIQFSSFVRVQPAPGSSP